jgi:DNA-binding response OmpR family regulator
LLPQTLTELGYSAVGFTSSAKALEAFLADPEQFDVVITDESMPGASGSELIRRMRAQRATLPILLVSGFLSAPVIERAREAGATEVLKKPMSSRQLEAVLERLLRPRNSATMNDCVLRNDRNAVPSRGRDSARPNANQDRLDAETYSRYRLSATV